MNKAEPLSGCRDITVICGWCSVYIRGPSDADLVSHGICPSCRKQVLRKLRKGRPIVPEGVSS